MASISTQFRNRLTDLAAAGREFLDGTLVEGVHVGHMEDSTAQPAHRRWSWWGRAVFHVTDVDAFYQRAVAEGLDPQTSPRDAEWGERYFHITDPDGHELSFARPVGVAKVAS